MDFILENRGFGLILKERESKIMKQDIKNDADIAPSKL